MLVDKDVAKDKGWKVGDQVPTVFGKTGQAELEVGGTYEQNQIAGNYLIGLDTYDANFTQRLDEVVAMTIQPDADPEAVRTERSVDGGLRRTWRSATRASSRRSSASRSTSC